MEVLTQAGPPGLAVVVVTLLALAWGLILALLPIFRLRIPAVLHVAGPALVVAVGGVGTLYGQFVLEEAVVHASAEMVPLLRAAGNADAGLATWLALLGASAVCLVSALSSGATNIARAEAPRWTPLHALLAFPGLLAAPVALLAGPWTALLALLGTLAVAVASLRIGEKDDLRRMAAGRALVGSLATGGVVLAGLAAVYAAPLARADALARVSAEMRGAVDAGILEDVAWTAGGATAGALLLGLAAFLVLMPVVKGLLDGRTSVGVLLAGLVALLPAVAVLPGVPPLLAVDIPAPSTYRTTFWAKQGLELVEVDVPQDPWSLQGTEVTVGVYWLYRDDERLAPYRNGVLDAAALAPDGTVVGLTEGRSTNVEVDRRTDLKRVLPILRTLRGADVEESDLCVVVREPGDVPGCVRVSFDDPTAAPIQVLLESEETLLIRGETLEPVDRGALADALRDANGRAAVHVRPEISAQRWIDATVALKSATGAWPILVLD